MKRLQWGFKALTTEYKVNNPRRFCKTLLCSLSIAGMAWGCAGYGGTTTSALKLRQHQDAEYLVAIENDGAKQGRIKEKEQIEKELLRRYEAGDKEAWLPMFGPER